MAKKLIKFMQGHVLESLKAIPDERVQCCATSPPYFGLRDYGTDPVAWPSVTFSPMPGVDTKKIGKQSVSLGLENNVWSYIGHLVLIFREVKRVLRDDGTLWVNLGDSYHGGGYANHEINGEDWKVNHGGDRRQSRQQQRIKLNPDLVPKSLVGIPWRFAFAMQADGWILRNDIIWAKSVSFNPVYSGQCMPESVRDRATRAHEYVFCFTKQPKYYYDSYALRENQFSDHASGKAVARSSRETYKNTDGTARGAEKSWQPSEAGRNLRSVWTINPQPFPDAHFAVWPDKIAEAIISLSTSEKGCCAECGQPLEREVQRKEPPPKVAASAIDRFGTGEACVHRKVSGQYQKWLDQNPVTTSGWRHGCKCKTTDTKPCLVLDPFGGAGTTAMIAARLRRRCISVELNPEYIDMAKKRIKQDILASASLWEKTRASNS